MNNSIFNFIKKIFNGNANGVLISFSAYSFLCFLICLLIKRHSKRQSEKGINFVYLVFIFSGIFAEISVLITFMENAVSVIFCVFISMPLSGLFLIIISLTKFKDKKEEIREIKAKENYNYNMDDFAISPKRTVENLHCKSKMEEKEEREEIDFSHVKNVLDRMAYYNLSPTDKRELRELKESVYIAENEGISEEKREKINDGLSALLKIMSKHGV